MRSNPSPHVAQSIALALGLQGKEGGKLSGEVGTNTFISAELEECALERLGLRPDLAPTQVISRDRHAEVVA